MKNDNFYLYDIKIGSLLKTRISLTGIKIIEEKGIEKLTTVNIPAFSSIILLDYVNHNFDYYFLVLFNTTKLYLLPTYNLNEIDPGHHFHILS